jgi:hypothetical protein
MSRTGKIMLLLSITVLALVSCRSNQAAKKMGYCFDAAFDADRNRLYITAGQAGLHVLDVDEQGHETYQETAAREILEETGAKIKEIQGVGHYVDSAGRLTVIAYAEVSSFEATPEPGEITEVALFTEIPNELSFADSREQLFLEYAREIRSARQNL